MDQNLAQKAISVALEGNWEKAIEINKAILKENSDDTDALNRLARAFAELGDMAIARKTAQKVLKIDPFNPIASKALLRWKGLRRGDTHKSQPSKPEVFLEEPGRTKIVSLIHLGSSGVVAKLDSADEVNLNTNSHRISITTPDGKYIGRLPDNLSARLKKLTRLGNEYRAFIKAVDKGDVKIFIREVKRSEKLKDIASFSSEKIDYVSFTPPELVHKRQEIGEDEEEE